MNKLLILISLLLSVAVLSGCADRSDAVVVSAERVCEAKGYNGAIIYDIYYDKIDYQYEAQYQCYVFTGIVETIGDKTKM